MNKQIFSMQTLASHIASALVLATMVLVSLISTGCSDSNPVNSGVVLTPGSPAQGTPTPLRQGSTLTFNGHQTDSNGITSNMPEETFTFGTSLQSLHSKQNVQELIAASGSKYLHYEADGDLFALDDDNNWQRIPFSGADLPAPAMREQVRGNERMVITEELKYIGEKTLMVGSEKLEARGLQVIVTIEHYTRTNVKDGTRVTRGRGTTNIYFVPAIGYFGEITAEMVELDYKLEVKRKMGSIEQRLTKIVRR